MLIAHFPANTNSIDIYDGWQYDNGQSMQITGLAGLPSAPQVHFAKLGETTTEARTGSVVDDVLTVTVPNAVFESPSGFMAFVYIVTEASGKTLCKVRVSLVSRAQPSDTVTTDQQSAWDENIAQLEAVIAAQEAFEVHAPYIGENGNWYIYDAKAGEYADSGEPSRGEQGEQGIPGTTPTIVNDLTTGGTTSALSAEQGKGLNLAKADKTALDDIVSNEYARLSNILNTANSTNGKYIDSAGVEQTAAGWSHTEHILAVEGDELIIYLQSSTGTTNFSAQGACYNSSDEFVANIANKSTPYAWIAPANTAYVIFNYGTSYAASCYIKNLEYDVNIPNRWAGKNINFLGTSITNGANLNKVSDRFQDIAKNVLGLTAANNYGVNGTRLANNVTASGADDSLCFARRYTSMTTDADLIVVECPTNDYGSASTTSLFTAPIGAFTDATDATFYGALHVLFQGLIGRYPNKPIIIMIDPHRSGVGDSSSNDLKLNPDTSKNLKDYIDIVVEVAQYYGIPILNLYKELTLNPIIAYHKAHYMPDGLHPNTAGHVMIANKLINFLRQL